MLVHISLTVQRNVSPNSNAPKSASFRNRQLGNLLKQLVGARIGDLGVEELIRPQIALDPGVADRRHGSVIQRRREQPRRTQQRDWEKRLDLIHVARSTLDMQCTQTMPGRK
jgi:hypothetical protein